MGRREEGTDAELRAAGSERAPGHVRLGVPSNLPAELSTFVGRADDLERGARLLGESRLATFTGAGGCGKTRLARQVAMRVAERFPGGVWWVELASLADGGLVTDRVARTLGLQTGETDAVADYFAGSDGKIDRVENGLGSRIVRESDIFKLNVAPEAAAFRRCRFNLLHGEQFADFLSALV